MYFDALPIDDDNKNYASQIVKMNFRFMQEIKLEFE